jgi:hypothetical protein
MLERCFVRQETLNRIRSSWLGPAVERCAAWLHERGYRVKTLAARVSILRQFGTFAQSHGAQGYEELPTHLEPFLHFWMHQPRPRRTAGSSLPVSRHTRVAIEQMLRVAVPEFVGRPRRQAIREPFANQAPGFSTYLSQERGLRDTTLGLYDEQVASLPAAVAVEQVLAAVDTEGGASILMQRAESDELVVRSGGAPAPVVPLQVLQQRNALFEPFQILTHGVNRPSRVRVRTCSSRSQARMVGEGRKIPPLSEAQGPRPEHSQKAKNGGPRQA